MERLKNCNNSSLPTMSSHTWAVWMTTYRSTERSSPTVPSSFILGIMLNCTHHSEVNSLSFLLWLHVLSQFKYGQLLTTIKLKSGRTLCLVQGFLAMQLPNGQPLLNDYECPLFTLSRTLFTVDSTRIQKAVSMVHECGNHCQFEKSVILNTVEWEQVADTKLVFLHDWTQLLYCLNVYCVL